MNNNVTYYSDGNGNWTKVIWTEQCPNQDVFGHECQGVKGHKGNHWQYKPDGSYHYWMNKDNPDAIEKGTAMGTVPPTHESYIEPKIKKTEYYMEFYRTEEVTDPEIISQLEKNNPPEKGAAIDRPLSENERKELGY